MQDKNINHNIKVIDDSTISRAATGMDSLHADFVNSQFSPKDLKSNSEAANTGLEHILLLLLLLYYAMLPA